MTEKFFYIRSRQRIIGPFTISQISGMLTSHLLDKDDLISSDRVSWKSIREVLEPPRAERAVKLSPFKTIEMQFFPPAEEEPAVLQPPAVPEPSPAEKCDDVPSGLPDPLCAAFGLLWDSPGCLRHWYAMLYDHPLSPAAAKTDRFRGWAVIGGVLLLQILLTVTFTAIMVPEWTMRLTGTVLVMSAAGVLLASLEMLFLSASSGQKRILESPLLMMFMMIVPAGAFAAGFPLCGLYAGGFSFCPWYFRAMIILMSAGVMIWSMINLSRGFLLVNKLVFRFKPWQAGILTALFDLQFTALFPIGWWICRLSAD